MKIQRRKLLQVSASTVVAGVAGCSSLTEGKADSSASLAGSPVDPRAIQPGMCMYPGIWRPWYPWEQIVWVRTPWTSPKLQGWPQPMFHDCVWLDFPEAIFSKEGLWFLSHINPGFPVSETYLKLPQIKWRQHTNGLAYARTLPNGLHFSGSLEYHDETSIDYELHFDNGSEMTFTGVTLQTCCYLKPSEWFSQTISDNKYVRTAAAGWTPMFEAVKMEPNGKYAVGWRTGPKVCDLPWILTKSVDGNHWVGMTWFEDTLSFIGNPGHPCVHADPLVGDLKPGQNKTIKGRLAFFTGDDPDKFDLPATL